MPMEIKVCHVKERVGESGLGSHGHEMGGKDSEGMGADCQVMEK